MNAISTVVCGRGRLRIIISSVSAAAAAYSVSSVDAVPGDLSATRHGTLLCLRSIADKMSATGTVLDRSSRHALFCHTYTPLLRGRFDFSRSLSLFLVPLDDNTAVKVRGRGLVVRSSR